MSLSTIVKAGNITNLSDARYCAGMGVEIVGFPVEGSPHEVLDITKIKEIAGWISGVKIALEFRNLETDLKSIEEMISMVQPDYIQLPIHLMEKLRKITNLPLLLITDSIVENILTGDEDFILFWGNIIENENLLKTYSLNYKVLLSGKDINADSVKKIINAIQPAGIELQGGKEISPGLKSFDELSEILELLEVE
jgi:phosphoribosylanthranilate isomerase